MKRLIECSTKERDLVLDPFNGSGSTGIASTSLNRSYIGIDNVVEYLKISKDRYLSLKKNE
jgi:site-specific DNA-methyltransferase (adenine-specific)